MAERSPSLGDRAEALLSSFGMPEFDEEALAARILARLDPSARGSTDSALLQPPLPDDAGEPGALPLSVRAELLDLESHSRLLPADVLQPVVRAPDVVSVPALSPNELSPGALPAPLVPAGVGSGNTLASDGERPTEVTELPAGLSLSGSSEGTSAAGLPGAGLPGAGLPGAESGAAALLRPALGGLTPAPPPSGQSLAALARAVAQSGSLGKGARSQVTDIAKESLSVAAAARAQTDAIVERVRSAEKAPESVPPPATPARVLPATPASLTTATTARSAPPPRTRSPGNWQWLALAGTLALAAGVVLVLRGSEKSASAPPALAETRAQAASPSPSLGAGPAPVEGALGEPHAASASPSDAPAVAAHEASAPQAEARAALAIAPRSAANSGSVERTNPGFGADGAASPERPLARAPSSARPARPQPESIVLEETPTASQPDANSATNPEAHLKPAAGSAAAGGLPDKPATGAVQAALGSVMGAARACVAGAATPTPAQIVFGS
ncbi:MAG TPA: hypothetical protein VFQ61_11080, partial [Polyangiaceae bacterium]|nr:hypothetical protein [Polyangiaceae bacterium]